MSVARPSRVCVCPPVRPCQAQPRVLYEACGPCRPTVRLDTADPPTRPSRTAIRPPPPLALSGRHVNARAPNIAPRRVLVRPLPLVSGWRRRNGPSGRERDGRPDACARPARRPASRDGRGPAQLGGATAVPSAPYRARGARPGRYDFAGGADGRCGGLLASSSVSPSVAPGRRLLHPPPYVFASRPFSSPLACPRRCAAQPPLRPWLLTATR